MEPISLSQPSHTGLGLWKDRVVHVAHVCIDFVIRIATKFLDLIAEIYARLFSHNQEPSPLINQELQPITRPQLPRQQPNIPGVFQAHLIEENGQIFLRGIFTVSEHNQIHLNLPFDASSIPRMLEVPLLVMNRAPLQILPPPTMEQLPSISPMDVESWKVMKSAKNPEPESTDLAASWNEISFEETRHLIEQDRAHLQFSGQANLIPHLWQMMQKPELTDETIIDFTQLVSTAHGITSRSIFLHLLKETYGTILAGTIIQRYNLYQDAPLTWKEIKSILVGIAANVKLSDLKELFQDLKKPKEERIFLCGCVLTPDFSLAENFEDLSQDEIGLLLNAFRTLPVDDKPFVPISNLIQKGGNLPFMRFDCAAYDAVILERFSFSEKLFDPGNLYLAASEYCGKIIGYLELKEGMIIPMRDEAGMSAFYTAAHSFMQEGLVCHLLTPVNPKSTPSLFLNFRGTQIQPARVQSMSSLVRDIDSSGIGKTVFNKYAQSILETIYQYLKKSGPVNLHINGHSLGAVDVQRTVAAIVHEIAEGGEDSLWRHVQLISATAHNSPGVEKELNEQFRKNLSRLPKETSIRLNYVLFNDDPIQTAGDLYLGALIPDITRRVILLNSESIRRFAAHNAKAFVGDSRHPFQITTVEEGPLLEELLTRNAYGPQSFWKDAVSFFYRGAQDAAYYSLSNLRVASSRLIPSRGLVSFL